ncbi:MAG: DUF4174 domain-containing protein [Verrucomicrobiota bacterium]
MRRVLGMAALVSSLSVLASDGQPEEVERLEDLQWRYRLMVGQLSSGELISQLRKSVEANAEALEDRKLLFVLRTPGGVEVLNGMRMGVSNVGVRDGYFERVNAGSLALVGLDGGIKAVYEVEDLDLDVVFDLIDGMPIRRAELRSRGEE